MDTLTASTASMGPKIALSVPDSRLTTRAPSGRSPC
jgi:hypothetical protein